MKHLVEIDFRVRSNGNSLLGRSMKYIKQLGLDPKREIAKLLECRFAALACKYEGDDDRGRFAAYEAIAHFEGIIQQLRELYQIEPLALPKTDSTPTVVPQTQATDPSSAEDAQTAARIARLDQRMAMNRRMFGD